MGQCLSCRKCLVTGEDCSPSRIQSVYLKDKQIGFTGLLRKASPNMRGSEEQKLPSSQTENETQLNEKSLVTTNANAIASHGGKHLSPPNDSDTFYIKLTHLLDSSGLTLVFNVRETLLDLYLFYLEVTRRGGYHQVGKEKKWGEVVSALKLEGSNVKLSAQIEKLYAHLLYQFEQLYFYRDPAKQAAAAGPLKRKWNSTACLSKLMDIKDDQMVTEVCKEHSSCLEASLLLCGGVDPDGPEFLRMAIDVWNEMSETEKQPYLEESKKKKEKFKEAMITDSKQQEKRPSLCGDYHVTLQPEADNSFVNKAEVGLDLKMAQKAPKDPLLSLSECDNKPIWRVYSRRKKVHLQ